MARNEQIFAKVEKVLFPREGVPGEFFILACDIGCCKGSMKWRPDVGESLGMRGEWTAYQGKPQFSFREVWHNMPKDPKALLHYACELTKGMGPAMETKIWDTLGENWKQISSCDGIPGLRGTTLNNFQDTIAKLDREVEKTDAISWLISVGCTRNLAEKAWDKWKVNTIGTVKGDPYILAELPNYGFTDIDNGIRLRFGIADLDERRIKAAIGYYMRQLADGPTVVSWWALRDKVLGHCRSLPVSALAKTTAGLISDGTLVGFTETQKLALHADYENELTIWEYANKDGEAK